MTSSQPAESSIHVLLLTSRRSKKILYMEAGKDFVDLLLSFLTLPTGTVLQLVANGASLRPIGAISKIFDSVKKLSGSNFYVEKDVLLDQKPNVESFRTGKNVLRLAAAKTKPAGCTYFRCSCYNVLVKELTTARFYRCERCHETTKTAINTADLGGYFAEDLETGEKANGKEGFVKKNQKFIVTDDLQILPASTITSISLLNKLQVDAMSDLESFEATVGPEQALQLLQSAFTSMTALNDVFHGYQTPQPAGTSPSNTIPPSS